MKFEKVLIILGLVLVAVGFWGIKRATLVETPVTVSQTFQVTQKVENDSVVATLSAKRGDTALSLLESSHKITVKKYSFGSLVESVDGLANGTDKKYWVYYVNGKTADVGADQYKLQPGDVVEWKFETEKQ